MKNKYFFLLVLLSFLAAPVHAGIDKVYGKKNSWWTKAYDELMSQFGIGKSYAIVIGISKYDDKAFANLPSEKDALKIKDYLINEAGFNHVHLITGEKVTVDRVREYMLDYYPKKLLKNDRFLFYWSGHGVTGGQTRRKLGYLALKKSSLNKFSSMISMTNIKQWDRRIKAKQTLYLLDACFSGIAASRAMSVRKEQTIQRINHSSRQMFTAGLENQQTLAINDIGGGVFTRALLDGLHGHADTDKGPFKKDGVVTIRELEEYVRERVDRERRRVGWNKPITPQLYNLSESAGDFFFISDKRIVKSHALMKNGNSRVIATGVKVNQPYREINNYKLLIRAFHLYDSLVTRARARTLFNQLALKGNSVALGKTSFFYIAGVAGFKKNTTLAKKMASDAFSRGIIDKALKTNNPYIQDLLGDLYRIGLGVKKDKEIAFEWYKKAANQGNAMSQFDLAQVYIRRKSRKDYVKAYNLLRKSAGQGYSSGQYALGMMYENGFGVEKNYSKALFWLKKSAGQRNPYGQKGLGYMFELGNGVNIDYNTALSWYLKARKNAATLRHKRAIDKLITRVSAKIQQ